MVDPPRPRPRAARASPATPPVWTIHSVAVRARDGPERLARAYRRLTTDGPTAPPSSDGDVALTHTPAAAGRRTPDACRDLRASLE